MNRFSRYWNNPLTAIVLIAVTVLLSACGSREAAPVSSLDDLSPELRQGVSALEESGLQISLEGRVDQPVFDAPSANLSVNGERVEAYDFDTATEADNAEALVGSGGILLNSDRFDSPAPPHFYRSGTALWIYSGETLAVEEGLRSAFREVSGG